VHLPRPLVLAILLPFGLYSAYAVSQVGYVGIFTSHFHIAGWQVLADLVIACVLAMVWMWRDAAATGRKVWPYLVLTLTLGSIGPLTYLLLAPERRAAGAKSIA